MKRPQRVERRIPEYNMIMFSKLEWLHDAITRDPFHSKYFFWIDGGYGKGQYFREPEYSMVRTIYLFIYLFLIIGRFFK